ncbi:MAG: winged helix-turn-helix domain-containing protein, partial [Thermoproteota archaeon]|nr:winged helix-turn-helix domain-containing protein [Thermoproteota archaeon]
MESESKRRDRLQIMAQILQIAKHGSLKTTIMYKANLSFAQLNKYLKLLLNLELLEAKNQNGRTVYKTTKKGFKYLKSYEEIKELLQSNNPENRNRNYPP